MCIQLCVVWQIIGVRCKHKKGAVRGPGVQTKPNIAASKTAANSSMNASDPRQVEQAILYTDEMGQPSKIHTYIHTSMSHSVSLEWNYSLYHFHLSCRWYWYIALHTRVSFRSLTQNEMPLPYRTIPYPACKGSFIYAPEFKFSLVRFLTQYDVFNDSDIKKK